MAALRDDLLPAAHANTLSLPKTGSRNSSISGSMAAGMSFQVGQSPTPTLTLLPSPSYPPSHSHSHSHTQSHTFTLIHSFLHVLTGQWHELQHPSFWSQRKLQLPQQSHHLHVHRPSCQKRRSRPLQRLYRLPHRLSHRLSKRWTGTSVGTAHARRAGSPRGNGTGPFPADTHACAVFLGCSEGSAPSQGSVPVNRE